MAYREEEDRAAESLAWPEKLPPLSTYFILFIHSTSGRLAYWHPGSDPEGPLDVG